MLAEVKLWLVGVLQPHEQPVLHLQAPPGLLPLFCMQEDSDVKPEYMPSNLPAEKLKPEKKPSEYQSAVARHLAESKECAMAYSDCSFRVVRACLLSSNLEIMEALYIKALAPNLCVQKSSIAHLQLFRHR